MLKPVLVALYCLLSIPAQAMQPSRPVEQGYGCVWQPFESAELGIRLLVQNCTDPNIHYEFSAKDGWLEQHRPSDPVTFGPAQIIRVLQKPADQTIQAAIARQFVAALDDKVARASCKVRPFKNPDVKGAGKQLFTILPTGAYARKIDKELKQSPRDFGCGEFGAGQSTAYFEYHPAESRTLFLYVDTGQDEPLFDQASIEIIGP
jgi:hypothetical protein